MNIVALFLLLAAFFAFGAGAEKQSRLTGLNLNQRGRQALKLAAFGLMAVSLFASIVADGPSIGLLIWFTLGTPCAAAVLLTLTYRPKLVPVAGLACCLGALGSGIASYII